MRSLIQIISEFGAAASSNLNGTTAEGGPDSQLGNLHEQAGRCQSHASSWALRDPQATEMTLSILAYNIFRAININTATA